MSAALDEVMADANARNANARNLADALADVIPYLNPSITTDNQRRIVIKLSAYDAESLAQHLRRHDAEST